MHGSHLSKTVTQLSLHLAGVSPQDGDMSLFWAEPNWVIWMVTRHLLADTTPALVSKVGNSNLSRVHARMPYGQLPIELHQAYPNGRRPWARPRMTWSDHISQLTWEQLGICQESIAGVKEVKTDTRWTLHS